MEEFNRVHSSIRNVIGRPFRLLKMKWHILDVVLPNAQAKNDCGGYNGPS
jgi:hypothetical protein